MLLEVENLKLNFRFELMLSKFVFDNISFLVLTFWVDCVFSHSITCKIPNKLNEIIRTLMLVLYLTLLDFTLVIFSTEIHTYSYI